MTQTVRALIEDALREIGYLGVGDDLDPDDGDLALRILQGMVDVGQGDRLQLSAVQRTAYVLTANQQTRTIGPGGVYDTGTAPRPSWIEALTVVAVGDTTELELVPFSSREAWLLEPNKTLTDLTPTKYWYEPTYALGILSFWPIPTTPAAITVSTPVPLGTITDLDTVITFQPGGGAEAWRLNLAKRLCRPFGQPLTPDLKLEARDALSVLYRLNDPGPPPAAIDAALVGRGGFDIRTGRFR